MEDGGEGMTEGKECSRKGREGKGCVWKTEGEDRGEGKTEMKRKGGKGNGDLDTIASSTLPCSFDHSTISGPEGYISFSAM